MFSKVAYDRIQGQLVAEFRARDNPNVLKYNSADLEALILELEAAERGGMFRGHNLGEAILGELYNARDAFAAQLGKPLQYVDYPNLRVYERPAGVPAELAPHETDAHGDYWLVSRLLRDHVERPLVFQIPERGAVTISVEGSVAASQTGTRNRILTSFELANRGLSVQVTARELSLGDGFGPIETYRLPRNATRSEIYDQIKRAAANPSGVYIIDGTLARNATRENWDSALAEWENWRDVPYYGESTRRGEEFEILFLYGANQMAHARLRRKH
jgi:hypothetical protein